ncbi:MAG: hypothetical protein ACE5IH_07095, partial [Thermodesulfobacteriota bacterium]
MACYRVKMILIAVIALIFLILLPRKGIARYRLGARVDYSYESLAFKTASIRRRHSKFIRKYDLDFKGNIWDPRFFVFNTGASFKKTTDTYIKRDSRKLGLNKYSFSGTFFPRFWYPLTLSVARNVRNDNIDDKIVEDNYGVTWQLRHWRLPKITWKLRYRTSASKRDSERWFNDIEIKKNTISTKNELQLSRNRVKTENLSETASDSVSFRNYSKFSWWDSIFRANARYINVESDKRGVHSESDLSSLLLGLSQKPLKGFSDSLQYKLTQSNA